MSAIEDNTVTEAKPQSVSHLRRPWAAPKVIKSEIERGTANGAAAYNEFLNPPSFSIS